MIKKVSPCFQDDLSVVFGVRIDLSIISGVQVDFSSFWSSGQSFQISESRVIYP